MAKQFRDRDKTDYLVDPEFASALGESATRSHSSGRHADHKARQLCRQVQRALNLVLGTGVDGALEELFILDVSPAPGCARLLVHVLIPGSSSPAVVLRKLREHAPRLRAAVARSISRKRAPELSFVPAFEETQHG